MIYPEFPLLAKNYTRLVSPLVGRGPKSPFSNLYYLKYANEFIIILSLHNTKEWSSKCFYGTLWNSISDSHLPTVNCLLPDVFSLPTTYCQLSLYCLLLTDSYFAMLAAYCQLYFTVYCLLLYYINIVNNCKTKLQSIFQVEPRRPQIGPNII